MHCTVCIFCKYDSVIKTTDLHNQLQHIGIHYMLQRLLSASHRGAILRVVCDITQGTNLKVDKNETQSARDGRR